MRAGLLVSVAAHGALALACVITWHRVAPAPAEVEGRIEVIFGKNARTDGAPAPAPGIAAPATAASPSAVVEPAGASPAAGVPGAASSAATFAPVRLGEGKVGFDVPDPDANLVAAQADPGNRPPLYPDAAFARHEHGTTVLGIHVGPDGTVARLDLLRSSGHADLDEAARAAVLRWHFIPQLRDGAAVPSYREQAIDFVM